MQFFSFQPVLHFDHREFDQICRRALHRRVDRGAFRTLAAHAVAAVDLRQPQATAEHGLDIALLLGLFARAVHVVFYAGIAREVTVDVGDCRTAFDAELLGQAKCGHAVDQAEVDYLGIERSAAAAYIDRYFARYPGVKNYMDNTREQAKQQGYVETVFGRRLWLPEINSSNGMRRQGAERAAINAPMQGTAADLIKLAMIKVQHWLEAEKLQSILIMQVHDELVLEVPEAELHLVKDMLPKLMCGVAELQVPLLVELGEGKNWDEAH